MTGKNEYKGKAIQLLASVAVAGILVNGMIQRELNPNEPVQYNSPVNSSDEYRVEDPIEIPVSPEWVDTNTFSGLENKVNTNAPVRTNSPPGKTALAKFGQKDVDAKELANYLIPIESSGNPKAVSRVGARGLLQIMPETWKEMTKEVYGKPIPFSHAFDPYTNKIVAIAYLEKIEDILSDKIYNWDNLSLNERQDKIAASYNGGVGLLIKNKGNISKMPHETRMYVQKLRVARGS